MKNWFIPFTSVGDAPLKIFAFGQAIFLLVIWTLFPHNVIPNPQEILAAWNMMAKEQGLLMELWKSSNTIWTAIFWSSLISFTIAYAATAAVFKPMAQWLTTFRFLGFAGITFLFTMWTSDGAELKIWLLTFGMTVFLLTNMLASIQSITQEQIDHARSLKLSGWMITYEIACRGKLDEALDLIRQNAAIGWVMLSMVEGIVRVEGGIGTLLINQNKHLHLAAIFALQITILIYGLLQDFLLKWIREIVCPYVTLSEIKK